MPRTGIFLNHWHGFEYYRWDFIRQTDIEAELVLTLAGASMYHLVGITSVLHQN